MNTLLQKLLIGGSTVALTAVMPAASAFAQDSGDIEQVVVSASRVSIAGYSQPTPVTVIGAAQLEKDAFSNIEDSLRQLPQIVNAPAYASESQAKPGQGLGGANFVNLRGLTNIRTLVLFDGQRVPQATIAQGVDITTLPAGVISRVDIVTGGASAAWGSDAVAGVANFVVNKNINGFHATIQGGDTGDGKVRDMFSEATWGEDIFGGRGHIEFAANAHIRPDVELVTDTNWFKGAYWVSNPTYAPGNGQSQLIMATNVGLATATEGGIISASPAGVAGPGVTPLAANALRGIEFVGAGVPLPVNYGNLTQGILTNGGTLGTRDTQAPYGPLTQPTNTYAFFAYGRYKLTDTIQASVMVNYGYFTGKGQSVPVQQNAVIIHSDNAYLPATVRAAMVAGGVSQFTLGTFYTNNFNNYTANGSNYFAMSEDSMGPNTYNARRNAGRAVFTLDGTLGDDWSWTAYIQHGSGRDSIHDIGIPIIANTAAATDAVTVTAANVGKSGAPIGSIACRTTLTGVPVVNVAVTAQSGCIPLDVFGNGVASPAAMAYVAGPPVLLHQSLQQDVMEGSMQGVLPWELPGGKVAVAFGMGYRKEQGVSTPSALAQLGANAQGDGTIMPASEYNVLEGFGEVDAPILKNTIVNSLDFSAAGRMTSYSTSGLVETWKLGATSQVNDDIKLRTTYSVDIRAPLLADLFTASGVAAANQSIDPKTQALVQAVTNTRGNPNLNPEVAYTVSGGVVLTPTFIPGFTLSADWYSISIHGVITSLANTTVVNQCDAAQASLIHPGQQGNPNDPLCSALVFNGPGGALSNINLSVQNFASLTTSGMDFSANYDMDFWDGTLSWSALANLNDEITLTNPISGRNDYAGSEAGSAPVGPKWRGILSATYNTGPYSVTAQGRWLGTSVINQDGNTGNLASAANSLLYDPAHFEMPFTAYLDLRGSYKWNDNISFFAAVDNATDVPPPLLLPTAAAVQAAGVQFFDTNNVIYDELGRVFRMGVRFNY